MGLRLGVGRSAGAGALRGCLQLPPPLSLPRGPQYPADLSTPHRAGRGPGCGTGPQGHQRVAGPGDPSAGPAAGPQWGVQEAGGSPAVKETPMSGLCQQDPPPAAAGSWPGLGPPEQTGRDTWPGKGHSGDRSWGRGHPTGALWRVGMWGQPAPQGAGTVEELVTQVGAGEIPTGCEGTSQEQGTH